MISKCKLKMRIKIENEIHFQNQNRKPKLKMKIIFKMDFHFRKSILNFESSKDFRNPRPRPHPRHHHNNRKIHRLQGHLKPYEWHQKPYSI